MRVILKNAGTIGLYTKLCFEARLYFQVAVFGELVSKEQGGNRHFNRLKTTGIVACVGE
jgi:hypothetical protein